MSRRRPFSGTGGSGTCWAWRRRQVAWRQAPEQWRRRPESSKYRPQIEQLLVVTLSLRDSGPAKTMSLGSPVISTCQSRLVIGSDLVVLGLAPIDTGGSRS